MCLPSCDELLCSSPGITLRLVTSGDGFWRPFHCLHRGWQLECQVFLSVFFSSCWPSPSVGMGPEGRPGIKWPLDVLPTLSPALWPGLVLSVCLSGRPSVCSFWRLWLCLARLQWCSLKLGLHKPWHTHPLSWLIGGKCCPSVSPSGPVPALFTDTQVESVFGLEEVERALLSRSAGQDISTSQHALPAADAHPSCLISSLRLS